MPNYTLKFDGSTHKLQPSKNPNCVIYGHEVPKDHKVYELQDARFVTVCDMHLVTETLLGNLHEIL